MLYGSQQHCTTMSPCDRSHQFTGAFVTTQKCQSMIAPTYLREVEHHSQKCQGSHASQGKGHHGPAEMPFMVHPSQPVYGSRKSHTEMPIYDRSHQLGKDIICTLIKPLLFLPFLLIYGSHPLCAEMLTEPRPNQFWANLLTQKCHRIAARLVLTRGHNRDAAMPRPSRLATKEIQYGYKI